jgi:hypothetical protein
MVELRKGDGAPGWFRFWFEVVMFRWSEKVVAMRVLLVVVPELSKMRRSTFIPGRRSLEKASSRYGTCGMVRRVQWMRGGGGDYNLMR